MQLQYYYLNSGSGKSKKGLTSFDAALISAGMGNYNLVRVSSILPNNCIRKNRIELQEGSPVHVAYGSFSYQGPNITIAAAVSVAIPNDNNVGVIMEDAGIGTREEYISRTEELVREAMKVRGCSQYSVLSNGIEALSNIDMITTVFSGLAMW